MPVANIYVMIQKFFCNNTKTYKIISIIVYYTNKNEIAISTCFISVLYRINV